MMNSSKLKVICMFFVMFFMISMNLAFAHRRLLISWGPVQEIVLTPRVSSDYSVVSNNSINFIVESKDLSGNLNGTLKCPDLDGGSKNSITIYSDGSPETKIFFQTSEDCYMAIQSINDALFEADKVRVFFYETAPIGTRLVTKILIEN